MGISYIEGYLKTKIDPEDIKNGCTIIAVYTDESDIGYDIKILQFEAGRRTKRRV